MLYLIFYSRDNITFWINSDFYSLNVFHFRTYSAFYFLICEQKYHEWVCIYNKEYSGTIVCSLSYLSDRTSPLFLMFLGVAAVSTYAVISAENICNLLAFIAQTV